ncbi:MAG: ComEC/Rec2 family competence protein [Actinomycetota bacterium]
MKRVWILPLAAACFGGGIMLGDRMEPPAGVVAVAAGVVLLLVGAVALGSEQGRDESGREPTGKQQRSEPDARARILSAAGIGGEPQADADQRDSHGRAWLRVAAVVVGFALLGGGWAAVRQASRRLPPELEGQAVAFSGTAASDLRLFDRGWGIEVSVDRLRLVDRELTLGLRVWVGGWDALEGVEAGQPVAGRGLLEAIDRSEGFGLYLWRRGVAASIDALEFSPVGPATNPALRAANAVRRELRRGAERALPSREAGLLLGLSIGDLSTFDPEVEEDFRATGLAHLVAVSGANVVMFLAPVLGLAMLLRLRAVAKVAFGLSAIGFFALLTRWEPSVLRASFMAAIALAGVLAGRPRNTAALLGGAVLVLLVADPALAWSLAFQLSVAATAGIVALAGPISRRLAFLPRSLGVAIGATVGAQVGVTPLLLVAFHVVPTVTVLANVLAFPAVPIALLMGLLASGVGLAWAPLGAALGKVATLPLAYLVGLADRLAHASLPAIVSEGAPIPIAVGLAAIVAAWRLRRGRRRVGTVVALVLVLGAVWSGAAGSGPPSSLTITFFNVGQGDSAVVRGPDGGTILIDAGPDEQQVAAKLAGLGVRRIDLAVASHGHADHVVGFPAVFARFPVGLFLEPGCSGDSQDHYSLDSGYLEAAEAEEVPTIHPRGGERFRVGMMLVEVVGPDRCFGEPNEDSIILRVSLDGASVLFTGDVETGGQQDLLDDRDLFQADVLKVPHHGSASSLEEFLVGVGAEIAVVSVGENDYGHPVPWVLRLLSQTGARIVRTDLSGDITLRFSSEAVLIESDGR